MKKNIVIFGATGNTGIYVVDYLVSNLNMQEYNVVAVGRKSTTYFNNHNIPYVQINIENKDEFDKLPKPHTVVHLAGVLPAYLTGEDTSPYVTTNVIGTLNILEYCRKHQAEKIFYSQSYADINADLAPNSILHPYDKRNYKYTGDHAMYIFSKNMAVDMIRHYHESYGIKSVIFRLPNIYLYHPSSTYYVDGIERVIPYRYMINKAIKGEAIEIWGNPSLAKDIVYVKDFAQMIYKAILADVGGVTYNVGTGIAISLDEQIKGIINEFSPSDKKSKIIYKPEKKDALSYIMDIENAKTELNYNPKFDYCSYLQDYKKEMAENRFEELWYNTKNNK